MKSKIFILIISSLFSATAFSQGGLQNIRFTAKPNAVNGLDIYAENVTGTDVSGTLGASSLTLCVLVPTSITPQPTVTIASPISGQTFFPQIHTASGVVINSITYDIYSYNGNGTTASIDFAPGVPVLIATYSFANSPVVTSTLLIAMLPGAGPSGFDNFYIALNGTDETDYSNPFYSDISSDPNLHNANGTNDPVLNSLSYLGITNVIVPVKFTGFSATKKDDNAILNWSVVNENTAGDSYEVERSFDDVSFTNIASVPVKGNSSSDVYNYTDDNLSSLPSTGTIYYRIEQVDKTGQPAYTDIKAVSLSNAIVVSAYPNPVKDIVSVSINLDVASNVSINVTDALGKQLQLIQLVGTKGANLHDINLANYAPGNYLLKVTSGSGTTTLPVVKQ